jgi:hypothetical protein
MSIEISKFKQLVSNTVDFKSKNFVITLSKFCTTKLNDELFTNNNEFSKDALLAMIKHQEDNNTYTTMTEGFVEKTLLNMLNKESSIPIFYPKEWKVGMIYFDKAESHYYIIWKIKRIKGIITEMLVSELTSSNNNNVLLESSYVCSTGVSTYLWSNAKNITIIPNTIYYKFNLSPSSKSFKEAKKWLINKLTF